MTERSTAPTDEQIVEAFTASIKQQAEAGVMLAKAVSGVEFVDGSVIVTLDPDRAGEGVEYWALMETAAYENKAETFGTPLAFDDEQGRWLRRRVERIAAVDVDGRPLGSVTAAHLHRRGAGHE